MQILLVLPREFSQTSNNTTACLALYFVERQQTAKEHPVNTSQETTTYHIYETGKIIDAQEEYVMFVRDLPNHDKPREKLISAGPKALNLAELIAIILGVGSNKEEVMTMARRIIREYGEKAIQHETNAKKLAKSLGIPITKSTQIIAAFELGRRFFAYDNGKPVFIRNSTQAYQHLHGAAYSKKEQLRGLYLNSRHELIHEEVISVGSLTANIVHPREVFAPALLHAAAAVIIAHNHPSGDSKPTPSDIAATRQLKLAGDNLGINLLDHIIITKQDYYSILLQEHLVD